MRLHEVASKQAKKKRAHGFDADADDAEKIIWAPNEPLMEPGKLFFLVKQKGREKAELLPAREENLKIPQIWGSSSMKTGWTGMRDLIFTQKMAR